MILSTGQMVLRLGNHSTLLPTMTWSHLPTTQSKMICSKSQDGSSSAVSPAAPRSNNACLIKSVVSPNVKRFVTSLVFRLRAISRKPTSWTVETVIHFGLMLSSWSSVSCLNTRHSMTLESIKVLHLVIRQSVVIWSLTPSNPVNAKLDSLPVVT